MTELLVIENNIVINVIDGEKARTYMFADKHVNLETIQAKEKELQELFND